MSDDQNVHLSNPAWIHASTSSQRIADHFISGRAALAGDAAHAFSSVAGQGIHCAIEDALNLGWKLGLTMSGVASPAPANL
jgi:2-polyprenyl-6-methoxyphenol hydroxylase-like FAD-dependent oxidoreductase